MKVLGQQAFDVVPLLIERLSDPSLAVRKASIEALGMLGSRAAKAVPKLLRMLITETNDFLYSSIFYTLEKIKRKDELVLHALFSMLEHPSKMPTTLHLSPLDLFKKLQIQDERFLPVLFQALKEGHCKVIPILQHYGNKRFPPISIFMHMLKRHIHCIDNFPIFHLLPAYQTHAKQIIPFFLTRFYYNSIDSSQIYTARILAGLGENGVQILREGIHHPDHRVRRAAVYGLRWVGTRGYSLLQRAAVDDLAMQCALEMLCELHPEMGPIFLKLLYSRRGESELREILEYLLNSPVRLQWKEKEKDYLLFHARKRIRFLANSLEEHQRLLKSKVLHPRWLQKKTCRISCYHSMP